LLISITFNFVLINLFIFFFKRYFPNKIPQGVGSILTFTLFILFSFNTKIIDYYFILILLLGSIYFLDDLRGLSPYLRIFIQMLSGIILYIYFFGFNEIFYLFCSGLLLIFFINIFNFQDGLDLNFASIFWQAIFVIYITDINVLSNDYFTLIISFMIVFTLYNNFHKIFLGDSGVFIFVNLYFFLLFYNIEKFEILYLFPILIPIIDFVYVLIKRLYLKENLLKRHEHHFYQIIGNKYNKYVNLIFQNFIFIILCLTYFVFEDTNFIFLYISILSCLIYLTSRFIFEK
jgi:UDP-N-acetylmuramyl pentapeptide phosphotransferase/UDP-N-acetylglucosamine-1-phosphate transferase